MNNRIERPTYDEPSRLLPYAAYSGNFANSCRHTIIGASVPLSSEERPATSTTDSSNHSDIPMSRAASDARLTQHFRSIQELETPFCRHLSGMVPNPRPLPPPISFASSRCHRDMDEDSLPLRSWKKKNPGTTSVTRYPPVEASFSRVPPARHEKSQPPHRDTKTYEALTGAAPPPGPFPPTPPLSAHIIYTREEWKSMSLSQRLRIRFHWFNYDWSKGKPKPWQRR